MTEVLGISRLLAVTAFHRVPTIACRWRYIRCFMNGIFPISGGALYTTQGSFLRRLCSHVGARNLPRVAVRELQRESQAMRFRMRSRLLSLTSTGREWWDRNIDTPESYTTWRNQWGSYYLDIHDARDLYYRMMAAGRGWVGDTPGFNGNLKAVLGSIKAKTLFIIQPPGSVLLSASYQDLRRSDSQCPRFGG